MPPEINRPLDRGPLSAGWRRLMDNPGEPIRSRKRQLTGPAGIIAACGVIVGHRDSATYGIEVPPALVRETPQERARQDQADGDREPEVETRLRLLDAIQMLAVRAAQLANELAARDDGGRMEDDVQSPPIGSVVAMQDLLKEIVTLFSVKPGCVKPSTIGGRRSAAALSEAGLAV